MPQVDRPPRCPASTLRIPHSYPSRPSIRYPDALTAHPTLRGEKGTGSRRVPVPFSDSSWDSMDEHSIQSFIERWSQSGGAERANYQLFLAELCDVLAVPRPDPTTDDDAQNAYVFERSVRFDNRDGTHSTKRIDLYKRGCFVCETRKPSRLSSRPSPSPPSRPFAADVIDEEILEPLVALNHERAEDERRGLLRSPPPRVPKPRRRHPTDAHQGAHRARHLDQAGGQAQKTTLAQNPLRPSRRRAEYLGRHRRSSRRIRHRHTLHPRQERTNRGTA